MIFDKGIFTTAWDVLVECRNWAFMVALIVAGATFLSISSLTFGNGVASIASLGWVFLAYRGHAVLLSVHHDEATHLRRSFGFILRAIGIGIVSMLPFIIIVLAASLLLGSAGGSSSLLLLVVIFALVISMILLTLLSTALPAYVASSDASFRAAFERGQRQWKFIVGNYLKVVLVSLLVSSILFAALWFVLSFVLQSKAGSLQESLASVQLIILIPNLFISAYASLLVPVILSRAFLLDEAEQASS